MVGAAPAAGAAGAAGAGAAGAGAGAEAEGAAAGIGHLWPPAAKAVPVAVNGPPVAVVWQAVQGWPVCVVYAGRAAADPTVRTKATATSESVARTVRYRGRIVSLPLLH